jgi:hypothetical protein
MLSRSLAWLMMTALAVAAPAEETLSLYYKEPAQKYLAYDSVVTEEVQGKDAKGKPEKTVVRTEQTIRNQYKLVGPDVLAVKAEFLDFKTNVNGKDVAYQPPTKEAQKLMDVKGYRKVQGKSAADFDKIDVILPSIKVKVGDTWHYTAPPTTDLPLYLVTRFTLMGIQKVDGRDVAVIDATTHASDVEPMRRLNISVHAKGRILFAHKEGVLVSSEFKIKMVTEPLKNSSAKITKNIRTSMKLKS